MPRLVPAASVRDTGGPRRTAFAAEDPRAFLARFPEGTVLDEVQRVPDLLSYLQGVIDADPVPPLALALSRTFTRPSDARCLRYKPVPISADS